MVDAAQLRAIYFYGTIEDNWLGHQMAEIYRDGIYRPYLPLIKEGTLALDIGANIGLASIFFSRYFKRVISLEPSEEHFDALRRNILTNTITNVEPVQKALFYKSGKFPFGGPKNNKTMRSLHMATWQDNKSDEVVEAITLEQLFEEYKIKHVDFLKLDIEGSETEIISSKSFKNVADKIDTIVGELHKWSGRHPNQLEDAFKLYGFSCRFLTETGGPQIFEAKRL